MFRYLSKTSIRGKRVLLRVDFNVPIVAGRVRDDFRIRSTLPTIHRLLKAKNSIILLSHHSDPRQTLRPVARHLSRILGQSVAFWSNPLDKKSASALGAGRLVLVENLRRWPDEEKESRPFVSVLAGWGDVFVNEAFSVAHRRGSSLTVLPRLLPSFIGLGFEKELKELDYLFTRPRRPLVAIFGGAKIKTKLAILRRFIRISDKILVGGAVANALLLALGLKVGRSAVDGEGPSAAARSIARSGKIVLPVDVVASIGGARGRRPRIASADMIGQNEVICDIGPKTRALFWSDIKSAKTIVWNGPLGFSEVERYSHGSRAIALSLIKSRGRVIVGGGDTIAFLDRVGLLGKFHHVSTGGGAMLAYLAGEKLPALEALKRSSKLKIKSEKL